MRIALVTETFPPEVNGVARTLWQLASGLTSLGHQVEVIRPRQGRGGEPLDVGWQEELTAGCPLPLYSGLRFGWPAIWRLRRRWSQSPRESRPDVVHVATEGPLGWSGARAARRLGIPVTSSFHTNFHQYGSFYGYGAIYRSTLTYLRRFHNATECTLVPAVDVQQALGEQGFERVEVLSRGVDVELFHRKRRDDSLRRSWGAGPEDPVALFVGRLAPEKNLALATQAFAEFRRVRPTARCVVVGDGPAARAMERQTPEAIFCGLRRGADLARHYASADILLFPSLTETFGNVVLEGMASGLVVLGFDYAASAALIDDGLNGFKAPMNDSDAWLTTARAVVQLPMAHLRAVGQRAEITAQGRSWNDVVRRFESILALVTGKPATGLAATKPPRAPETPPGPIGHAA